MSRTALTDSMKLNLPETRALYRIGPTMGEALLILARSGPHRSRRALAQAVMGETAVGLRAALYSIARLVEMGLVLDDPVRLSDVGRRYVARVLRGVAPETARVVAPVESTVSSAPAPRGPASSAHGEGVPVHLCCPQCGADSRALTPSGHRQARCGQCWASVAW